MFKIFADDLCFYDDCYPEEEYKVISPKLKLTDNSAGSLTFTLPPCNVAYNEIKRFSTYIYVYRDDEEIWSGRVVDESKDFWNDRLLTCEGRLAFLNDTIQPKWTYTDEQKSLSGLLEHFISVHNSALSDGLIVNTSKRFDVGNVSISLANRWSLLVSEELDDSDLFCTNYESTFECIRSKIVEPLGGHIWIQKIDDHYFINYMDDSETPNDSEQRIDFGNNLTDFTRDYDLTSLVTVVIPLGARLENSDDRLTIDSIKVSADPEVIREYGCVEKVVEWSEVEDEAILLQLAKEYLNSTQFDNLVLGVKGVDLHYLNPSIKPFNLLDRVKCISKPHGLNEEFIICDIDIPLDDPTSTVYTLRASSRGKSQIKLSKVVASSSSNNQYEQGVFYTKLL